MNETLDEIQVENNQKKFSRLSFALSILTLVMFVILFASFPKNLAVGEKVLIIPIFMIFLTSAFFCVLGVILMIVSFVKKEPNTWFKWVGGVLNTVWFLIFIGTVIFARAIQ